MGTALFGGRGEQIMQVVFPSRLEIVQVVFSSRLGIMQVVFSSRLGIVQMVFPWSHIGVVVVGGGGGVVVVVDSALRRVPMYWWWPRRRCWKLLLTEDVINTVSGDFIRGLVMATPRSTPEHGARSFVAVRVYFWRN